MAWMNLLDDAALVAVTDRRVFSPEEFGALETAQQLVSQCRAWCEAQQAKGTARAQAQERLGYQQGQERAAHEAARRLLEFERSHAQAAGERQRELADLVMVVLERLAPELAEGRLIRTLARQAVEHSRHASRLLLKVHPECVLHVEAEIDMLRHACAWLDSIEVIGVDGMRLDECLLESPHGFVNASWQTQIGAIRSLIDALVADTPANVHQPAPPSIDDGAGVPAATALPADSAKPVKSPRTRAAAAR
jgi:flagellar biosynthesis/type III secretory pathway protein FliH